MTTDITGTPETLQILLVGSDHAKRALKAEMLVTARLPIDEAGEPPEALERLASGRYALVLIELASLDASAAEVLRRFKRAYPLIPILVTTAADISAETGSVIEDLKDLADGLLLEPVAPLELVIAARGLLRLGRSIEQGSGRDEVEPRAERLSAQLEALYAASIDAIVSIDNEEIITSWNAAAERVFGFHASEALGERFCSINGAPDELTDRHQYLQRLRSGEPIEYQLLRHRKDGQQIETLVRGAPIITAAGQADGASFVVRDVTALKHREQHVHFLMRELTHRSKNLLAVIQAMARQSLSHLSSPEEFVTRFSERLSGLAGSHDLLSSVDWEGASLVDLIRSQLRHYEDRFDEKIHLDGPDLFLRPEAAQNIGIALHELSTNAAKYGALSVPGGRISIAWHLVEPETDAARLQMTWQEKNGPAVLPPGHKGFGHVVMERITGQALGGTSRAEFSPGGVNWYLDVPAASVVLEREKQE